MKILYLGPETAVSSYLRTLGDVTTTEDKITSEEILVYDWIISYGYRHIISEEVIKEAKNLILNLHISFLPWNRGANPNFWSWLEGTPKGVTIHQIDSGIDTGPIYVQKEVEFGPDETLATSYKKLKEEIEDLFISKFEDIVNGSINPYQPTSKGTYHSKKDFEQVSYLLVDGWDTPVECLI